MLPSTITKITSKDGFKFHINLLELQFTIAVMKYIVDELIASGDDIDALHILSNIPGVMEEVRPHRHELMDIFQSVLQQYVDQQ